MKTIEATATSLKSSLLMTPSSLINRLPYSQQKSIETIPLYLYISLENESSEETSVHFPVHVETDCPGLEQITIKRLKTVEKGCEFPYIGVTFIRGSIFDEHNRTICSQYDRSQAGLFECVQLICDISKGCFRPSSRRRLHEISQDGYIVFAYKTMEDMYNPDFAKSWKTWTGARLLCQSLPDHFVVKRLSFFKKIRGSTTFTYIMMLQIEELVDCAPALNAIHYIKPRICAFVGTYREVAFKISSELCRSLHIGEEYHINAFTSHMRVLYCNNSTLVEFPAFLEYRTLERIRDENHSMVSEETQTSSQFHSNRRTLPRTISIYDFPSMQKSTGTLECLLSTSFHSVNQEEAIRNLFGNAVETQTDPVEETIPKGTWSSKLHSPRKEWKACTETPKPRSRASSNITRLTLPKEISQKLDQLSLMEKNVNTNRNTKLIRKLSAPNGILRKRSRSPIKQRISPPEPGDASNNLLRRLKEKYFNSPDYTREEMREFCQNGY